MKEHCEKLKQLYSELPSFGHGTIEELDRVHNEYNAILVNVGSLKEHEFSTHELRRNSADIEMFLTDGRKAKTEKLKKEYFDRAANDLSLDMQSLMEIIQCS